jgi:redox-sensing transcriptional repressor
MFADHGFNITAIFDNDPAKVGDSLGGVGVQSLGELASTVTEKNIIVGVLAVPASAAQDVADQLIDAGVRIIFNYSEALLSTPSDVIVHSTSPAVELLHALYFYLT